MKWQSRRAVCLVNSMRTAGKVLVFTLIGHFSFFRIPCTTSDFPRAPLNPLKCSRLFPTVIFSVYLESWSLGYQQGGPLLAFSSFNLMSAASGLFPPRLVVLFFHVLIFKKLLRPVVSAFALNLSWAIAIGTIFYNDILNTHRPINICCMLVTYTKWWLQLNVAIR